MSDATATAERPISDEQAMREIDRMLGEMKQLDQRIGWNHEETVRLRAECDRIHAETRAILAELADR